MIHLTPIALFTPIANQLRQTSQPPGRGAAIAGSLLELAVEASDLLIDPAKIRQAYALLGAPRQLDDVPIVARRTTCREIAAAIEAAFTPGSSLDAPIASMDAVLPWWVAAVAWPGEDPRSVAIRTTGAREHAELVAAITGRDGETLNALRRRLARDRQS